MVGLIEMRVELLGQFDKYIRTNISNENIHMQWLSAGVPDGSTKEDLYEIAADDELWLDCVNAFANCLRLAKII